MRFRCNELQGLWTRLRFEQNINRNANSPFSVHIVALMPYIDLLLRTLTINRTYTLFSVHKKSGSFSLTPLIMYFPKTRFDSIIK